MSEDKKAMWRDEARRKKLAEILPLDTPLALNIEVSSGCNLNCCYCLQSLSPEQKQRQNFIPQRMDFEVFKKIVDGCKAFKRKIKVLRFSGLGEPFFNPRLPEMIGYANQSQCFEKLMVFTNGCLMTPQKSEEIQRAGGIDSLLLDIQGLSSQDYRKNSGAAIDFDALLHNIRYFYTITQRAKTEVFVKIYHFAVAGRESLFFDTFSPIADHVSIDNIYEAFKHVDYTGLVTKKDVFGNSVTYEKSRYCPYPFFQITVNADGTAEACCNTQERSDHTLFIGNVRRDPLTAIWNGKRLREIRLDMLEKGAGYDICRGCMMLEHLPSSDRLDTCVPRLAEFYSTREPGDEKRGNYESRI